MRKWLPLAAEHYKPVLLAILAITLAAAWRVGDLRITITSESMMVADAPAQAFYELTRETFGADEVTLLILQDDELFHAVKLEALRSALRRIEGLPFVARTDSLFSIQHIRDLEGTITWNPYIDVIPDSAEEGLNIRDAALRNPLIAGDLLSQDGSTMAIAVYLTDEPAPQASDAEIVAAIEAAIRPLAGEFDKVFQIGPPAVRDAITQRILQDQVTLLPLSVVVLVLALTIAMKRPRYAPVPLLTAGLSVLWTLGFMAALGIPLNLVTAIVPALLIIVGSTEDIHLLTAYQAGIREGRGRGEAIGFMASSTGLAVLLTFVTTYLGFLSIAMNDIRILQQFGLVASTGLLFNFVITVLLVPIYLRFFGESGVGTDAQPSVYSRLALWTYPVIQRHKRRIGLLSLAMIVAAGLGALQLRVNNDALAYFSEDAPIKSRVETVRNALAGMHSLDIVLDGRIEGTFLKVRYLGELEKLQDFIARSQRFGKSTSFADYVAVINHVMDEAEEDEALYLPETDEVVQEYMNFTSHELVKGYISPDFSTARIVVRHGIDASRELGWAVEEIQTFVRDNIDPDLDVRITGGSVLTSQAADQMAWGQAQSLGLMLVTIFLIVSVLFMNPSAGLLALVPNLIPIIVLFAIMGYLGIPLDTGTAMIAAISIGISVDDTIHFMARYHQEMRQHPHSLPAIQRTMELEATPIAVTSIALMLGFAALGLSSFPPVIYFGLLSALVILLALVANFVVTPLLLSHVQLTPIWELLRVRIGPRLAKLCPVFQQMSPLEMRKVLLAGCPTHYPGGERVFRPGDPGEKMYVVLDGQVEVRKTPEGGEAGLIETLGPGEVFGVIGLATNGPHLGEAITRQDTELLALDWETLRCIGALSPRISAKLHRNLCVLIGRRLITELEQAERCGMNLTPLLEDLSKRDPADP